VFQESGEKPTIIAQTTDLAEKTQRWLRIGIDIPLVLAIITLVMFGLLMVYSSSWKFSIQLGQRQHTCSSSDRLGNPGDIYGRVMSRIDYHRYSKLMLPAMVVTYGLLLTVLILGIPPRC
jgi:cell division protein FtsW (lipid II flippase)